jgi:excisionase family DNA binding protein
VPTTRHRPGTSRARADAAAPAALGQLLTISEAAVRIGMSVRYVRRLVSERRIAFHRLGRSIRLAESDLAAHVAAARVEPITSAIVWRDLRRVA